MLGAVLVFSLVWISLAPYHLIFVLMMYFRQWQTTNHWITAQSTLAKSETFLLPLVAHGWLPIRTCWWITRDEIPAMYSPVLSVGFRLNHNLGYPKTWWYMMNVWHQYEYDLSLCVPLPYHAYTCRGHLTRWICLWHLWAIWFCLRRSRKCQLNCRKVGNPHPQMDHNQKSLTVQEVCKLKGHSWSYHPMKVVTSATPLAGTVLKMARYTGSVPW